MDVIDRVKAWIEEIIQEDEHLFLVDIFVADPGRNAKVTVYIDGDAGVSIDTCARVSRQLSKMLDENELFEGNYTLEISSPGLSYPLKLKRQYINNVGREVKVILHNNQEKTGTLTKVEGEYILIRKLPKKKKQQAVEEESIPFADIKKTNVMASFN